VKRSSFRVSNHGVCSSHANKQHVCTTHDTVSCWQFLMCLKDCVCISHRHSAGPPGEVLPLWPGWKWLQGHLKFTEAVMAKSPAQAVWNSCGWDGTFRSQSCASAASSCGCCIASSRHLWSVQSSQHWCEDSLVAWLAALWSRPRAPRKGLTAVNERVRLLRPPKPYLI
jgi:hypothetical protein